jgi:acyl carrier protein
MTLSQWNATVQSKVQTSWNLHKLLPKGLDFFILLSSLAGIYGSVSQANYSAGNNFQDALARYRTSQGEKAIAFNLGWMKTIGIIAETAEYQTHRARAGNMVDVETDEFFGLLQIYCDPAHPILEPSKSQLLVGVVTPADCQEQGTEVPDIMRHPLFSTFAMSKAMPGLMEAGEGAKPAILFKQAKTEEEKVQVVVDALAVKLGRALSMLPDDVDSAKPLVEYGVDSLVAVELRNWIGKEFSADVAVFDIMGGSTISVIGQLVAKRTTCL